jgi:hypothetical protein
VQLQCELTILGVREACCGCVLTVLGFRTTFGTLLGLILSVVSGPGSYNSYSSSTPFSESSSTSGIGSSGATGEIESAGSSLESSLATRSRRFAC